MSDDPFPKQFQLHYPKGIPGLDDRLKPFALEQIDWEDHRRIICDSENITYAVVLCLDAKVYYMTGSYPEPKY